MSQITKNKHRTTVFSKIWIFQISHCRRNWEHPVVPEYFRPVQDKCVCENLNFSNFTLSQEMGTFCRSRIFEAGTGQMSSRKFGFLQMSQENGHSMVTHENTPASGGHLGSQNDSNFTLSQEMGTFCHSRIF